MKHIISCVVAVNLFLSLRAVSQEPQNKLIEIGQKMPDLVFNTIINFSKSEAKLSDFKGKSVILDLWHNHCSACILGFPKMQDLQDKFKTKIQIIALTFNNLDEFNDLKKRSNIIQKVKFPFALNFNLPGERNKFEPKDGAIRQLFGNMYYPTHVWIDKDGILRAVTGAENATEENIQKFIEGGNTNFTRVFNNLDRPFKRDTSLLYEGNGRHLKNMDFHSLFIKGPMDLAVNSAGNEYYVPRNKFSGIRRMKMTMVDFVKEFWSIPDTDLHIAFESKELKDMFLVPRDNNLKDEWYKNNTFSYELSLPEGRAISLQAIRNYAKPDVERFFSIKVNRKKQLVKCLEIYGVDERIRSKEVNKKEKEYNWEGITLINYPMVEVTRKLASSLNLESGEEFIPIYDRTGYASNIDLSFNGTLKDIQLFIKDLRNNGLEVRESSVLLDCLVISKENI